MSGSRNREERRRAKTERRKELARMTPSQKAAKHVHDEQVVMGLLKGVMVGPVRGLDLLNRAPDLCKRRGWFPDDKSDGAQGFSFVALVCGAYAVGFKAQRFNVPKAFLQHEQWRGLVTQDGPAPMAYEIVEGLDLDDLTKQPQGLDT